MDASGLCSFATSTLHEAADRTGALPAAIKPIHPAMRVCGPAFPVACAALDNLRLHEAIYCASEGDVLVVDVGGAHDAGYFGEIMTRAAIARRIAGLVIDGCVRDGDALREIGLPIFARGLAIRGTTKDRARGGSVGEPVNLGDVSVRRGDLVVGDGDGVVVIPSAEVAAVVDRARARVEKERAIVAALAAGRTTLELYGLETTTPVEMRRQDGMRTP